MLPAPDRVITSYSIHYTKLYEVGPANGMSEMLSAADEPIIPRISGSTSGSTDITIATICTSFLNPLSNNGLNGLSISLDVSIACSGGFASLLVRITSYNVCYTKLLRSVLSCQMADLLLTKIIGY